MSIATNGRKGGRPNRPPDAPGLIQAGQCYTLAEFRARTGMGEHALRTARRRGLRLRYVGRCGYVLADDWFAYLESAPDSRS